MILKNKYVVGCLVQFYEIEMLPEYLESCVQMLEKVENKTNVTFHFTLGFQEYLEKYDGDLFELEKRFDQILDDFYYKISAENRIIGHVQVKKKWTMFTSTPAREFFYNVAAYRRELNDKWCEAVDFVLWGETDSLWPKQTLEIIEYLKPHLPPKFILNFADRKMWDPSWDIVTHPLFEKVQFIDTPEWSLNNEASGKSYMSLERMNEINDIPFDEIEYLQLDTPKFDGSCLVISSELIKSGVNIPHGLLHCGEDTAFGEMAKIIMQNQFLQICVKNILRVHNRRHPKKRMYISGESNPNGFCGLEKGQWWIDLENASKANLSNIRKQERFIKFKDLNI